NPARDTTAEQQAFQIAIPASQRVNVEAVLENHWATSRMYQNAMLLKLAFRLCCEGRAALADQAYDCNQSSVARRLKRFLEPCVVRSVDTCHQVGINSTLSVTGNTPGAALLNWTSSGTRSKEELWALFN